MALHVPRRLLRLDDGPATLLLNAPAPQGRNTEQLRLYSDTDRLSALKVERLERGLQLETFYTTISGIRIVLLIYRAVEAHKIKTGERPGAMYINCTEMQQLLSITGKAYYENIPIFASDELPPRTVRCVRYAPQ